MAESNAFIGLRQDIADFFYLLDELIYDLKTQRTELRQRCISNLMELGHLVASIRRSGEWMLTVQPPPPVSVVNNATLPFWSVQAQRAPNILGTRFTYGCWKTREELITLLHDFHRGRSNGSVAAALQGIWNEFLILDRHVSPTRTPPVQRPAPLLPGAQLQGELRAYQQAGLEGGSQRASQAGPIRTTRPRATRAEGPYVRPRRLEKPSSDASDSSEYLPPFLRECRIDRQLKDPNDPYVEPLATPVRSIEEWQFGEITDSPGAEMEDDEYVLIKAMIELIPVQAERDQSTEGPIETDEPIGQPVGEPVLNPRQELPPVPQGIRTLLIQSTARPGYVREHDLQPNELFLGVRMRRTPIKEEPEEGEIAHTPPPWKYSIHSILTRSVQAPCAIKTERLSPGETFAGFKMPGLVSPSLDSSPIDFAMRREMRMISNYSSRDDSDASEVEFDSYDSFLDDEFSEDEDDFHESETERQPSKFLIFPPRVQRRLEIPLRPTNGTLVDTVEKDEVYVLMRMNDDPIKSEEYDEPSKKWPPDFRVVRARNGKPLHNIRQRTFLIDDEVYIRAAAQPPIKFERFTSLPPLPSHSWASPSRIPTLPPFPPPRPPVSINLMGRRSVMPWPRSTSLVPQHRATSSAPDARLPGPPGSPRNY